MKHHLKDGPVLLRKLRDSDIAPMAILANNKNIWNNVRDFFPYPYTEKHAEEFIKASAKEKESFTFAIVYHEEFAGVISLIPLNDVYLIIAYRYSSHNLSFLKTDLMNTPSFL